MKRLVIASTVLLLAACTSPSTQTPNSSSPGTAQGIEVSAPMPGSIVTSPLAVKGKATGNWFFEASMPMLLTDASGVVIESGHVQAQGDWMTDALVDFDGEITFTTDASEGFLVLQKDNPSGLPENDAQVKIPVRFK